MAALTIRNLSDETHRALKARAAKKGVSTEAEVRDILDAAMQPRLKIGSELAGLGKHFGGVDLDIARDEAIEHAIFE